MRSLPSTLTRCALFLLLIIGLTMAAPGFGQNRQDVVPGDSFAVTPEAGPYMIIVTSYRGEQSGKIARDLCQEIRTRYKMSAYTYDWGAERRRQQDEELRQRREVQLNWLKERGATLDQPLRQKKHHIDDEHAVFVGGFKDWDAARKELDRIKKLDPPKSVPLDTIFVGSINQAKKENKKDAKAELNPFLQSFVVRNPTIKTDRQSEPEKPDPLLKSLNAHEKYSLAQAKKPWTLVVKEYYGTTVIQPQSAPDTMLKKLFGEKPRSLLEAGAHDAREIVRGLRAMNVEAYVLHTRYGSVVTVGSYDSLDDPKLLQNQRAFANLQVTPYVQLSMSPLPMKIPELQ